MFLAQPRGLCSGEQTEFALTASMGSDSPHLGSPYSLFFPIHATGDRDMGQALTAPGKPQISHLYTGGRKKRHYALHISAAVISH